MADEDLRFPPVKRREPAKFEPPPWEREQFDELAKTRGGEEPAITTEEAPGAQAPSASIAEQVVEAVREAQGEADANAASNGAAAGTAEKPAVDPKRVEVMLMGLRAEEPRPEEAYWRVTTAAGGVSALIGFVITTWAIVAFATVSKGKGGAALASVLLLFGLGFAGGGVWLVTRTLRQRGVL